MTPIRPTQPTFPDSAALLRFVSGQSPLAEAEAIRAWLAADFNRQASVEELQAAWCASNVAVPAWDKDGVWAKLSNERAVATAKRAGPAPRRPDAHKLGRLPSMAPQRWTSIAARAAAILLVVGASATLLARRTHTEPAAMREITTTHGERSVIQLDDGTRVTLDAASRLRVPTDLGVSDRTLMFWRSPSPRRLELTGRALFDVKHDAARPFIVETSTATTQDVGTAFVITAYPEASATQVAVVEGSVALWEPSASTRSSSTARDGAHPNRAAPLMTLTRGDVATLDARGTTTRTRGVAVASFTAWTEGVLAFEHAPLKDVILELNRWYDIDIRLSDSALGARRLTAEIRKESVGEAMQRIGLVLDVRVAQRGRTVVLSPRNGTVRRMEAR